MKKILSSLILCSFIISLKAQEPTDALRYAWNTPGATARIQAVGGAMGSLGGDITATFVNPAGLAFYRTGDFVLTPQFRWGRTRANYLGREEKETNQRFNFGTSGFVWGEATGGRNRANNSFAASIAYTRTADFNSRFQYRGVNTSSSFSQRFLDEIGNIKDGNAVASGFPTGTSQAFNTFWVDTVGGSTNGNFQFQSRSLPLLSTGLLQQQTVETSGGMHEVALGLAGNFNNKWMLGATIGIPFIVYNRNAEFVEADATTNANNKFDYGLLRENFQTRGVGINIKLGAIYKPQEFWRIGLAFHTPSLLRLTDTYDYTVITDTEGYRDEQKQTTKDITGAESAQFKYMIFTPYRVIGSISYVLREIEDVTKQRGFITADVEYVNYAATSFTTHDEVNNTESDKQYLRSLNQAIDKAYKGAFNFRAGAELKFTTIMFRLGAAYYGNPYRDIKGENGERINLSGGLGYRNKGFFIDLTYVHALNRDVHFAYRLNNGNYSGADLRNTTGNAIATIGWKF
jgi:hypothetical protein